MGGKKSQSGRLSGYGQQYCSWQEDFHPGFEVAAAQKHAVDYLNRIIGNDVGRRYRVGGHSKGGNLAAYGVMMCRESVRDRIMEIYMNDSPGIFFRPADTQPFERTGTLGCGG